MKFKKKKYNFSPPEKYRTGEALHPSQTEQGSREVRPETHKGQQAAAVSENSAPKAKPVSEHTAVLPLTPERTERLLHTVELNRAELERAIRSAGEKRGEPAEKRPLSVDAQNGKAPEAREKTGGLEQPQDTSAQGKEGDPAPQTQAAGKAKPQEKQVGLGQIEQNGAKSAESGAACIQSAELRAELSGGKESKAQQTDGEENLVTPPVGAAESSRTAEQQDTESETEKSVPGSGGAANDLTQAQAGADKTGTACAAPQDSAKAAQDAGNEPGPAQEREKAPEAVGQTARDHSAAQDKEVSPHPEPAADSAQNKDEENGAAAQSETENEQGREAVLQNLPEETGADKEENPNFWRRLVAPANLAFLLLALLLMGPLYLINYAFGDLYYLYEQGERVGTVFSDETEHEAIFALAGFALHEADRVEAAVFGDSTSLYLTRAYGVTVTADGKSVEHKVLGHTTAQALEQLGITLGPDDLVEPALDKVLEPGEEVVVRRVWYETREAVETVAWQEVDEPSPLIAEGKTQVMNEGGGRDGLVYRTYQDKYIDGELVQSEVIEESYEDFPWNVVTLVGDDDAVMSPIDGAKYTDVEIVNNAPQSYERVLENAVCTAYSFKPGTYGASGMYMFQGFVAVNTNVIPYGSLLYITSPTGNFTYGWAIAADVGEAMMAGYVDIDLFFETYTESALFGKHRMNVYVVDQLTQSELEEFMAQPGMFRSRIPAD